MESSWAKLIRVLFYICLCKRISALTIRSLENLILLKNLQNFLLLWGSLLQFFMILWTKRRLCEIIMAKSKTAILNYILLWAKTKVNFFIKWKIFIYLFKSISSPSDIMHPFQSFFQSSKHLLNSISEIVFKAFFGSACISSIVWKRCPQCGLLSLRNSQKSHGAKSGEYGGCGTICVEFLAKWSRRTSAVWDGALSWCKNHELSAQNIFWNGVQWSSWNANSVSKVSNFQSTILVH